MGAEGVAAGGGAMKPDFEALATITKNFTHRHAEPLAPLVVDRLTAPRGWMATAVQSAYLLHVDMSGTPRFDPLSLADHIGEPIDVTGPYGARRRMLIREVAPTVDGGAMLTLEEACEPVPASPYPDPIPRDDQDSAHACCAPVRGAEVPPDQVRPARDATGGRDER